MRKLFCVEVAIFGGRGKSVFSGKINARNFAELIRELLQKDRTMFLLLESPNRDETFESSIESFPSKRGFSEQDNTRTHTVSSSRPLSLSRKKIFPGDV